MKLSLRLATPVQTLVLIGGGEFSFGETREIDQTLIARMPPDRRVVAFLPTASGSAEYAGHFRTYLQGLDSSVDVVNVPLYRTRDSRRQKNLDMIRSAGMVYLGGGVASTLLATIRESPAELALREAAASGAVVAAIGAAASCFGLYAHTAGGASPIPALSWVDGAVVESGWTATDDTVLRRLMSLPDVELGLGIPSRTALVIGSDGGAEISGDGQVAAFRKP